jgi:hypothetical protein
MHLLGEQQTAEALLRRAVNFRKETNRKRRRWNLSPILPQEVFEWLGV